MEIDEVSIVDRAANKRKFLVVKGEEMDEQPVTEEKTEVAPAPAAAEPAPPAPDPDSGPPPEEKQDLSIPGPVKEAMLSTLTEALERLVSLVNAVKGAVATTEQTPNPVPEAIGGELVSICSLLAGIGEKYPSPVAAAEPVQDACSTPGEKKPEEENKSEEAKAEESKDAGEAKAEVASFDKGQVVGEIERLIEVCDKADVRKEVAHVETEIEKSLREAADNAIAKLATYEQLQAQISERIAKLEKAADAPRSVRTEGNASKPVPKREFPWEPDMARNVGEEKIRF